jgi:hypothetical protein
MSDSTNFNIPRNFGPKSASGKLKFMNNSESDSEFITKTRTVFKTETFQMKCKQNGRKLEVGNCIPVLIKVVLFSTSSFLCAWNLFLLMEQILRSVVESDIQNTRMQVTYAWNSVLSDMYLLVAR